MKIDTPNFYAVELTNEEKDALRNAHIVLETFVESVGEKHASVVYCDYNKHIYDIGDIHRIISILHNLRCYDLFVD